MRNSPSTVSEVAGEARLTHRRDASGDHVEATLTRDLGSPATTLTLTGVTRP